MSIHARYSPLRASLATSRLFVRANKNTGGESLRQKNEKLIKWDALWSRVADLNGFRLGVNRVLETETQMSERKEQRIYNSILNCTCFVVQFKHLNNCWKRKYYFYTI